MVATHNCPRRVESFSYPQTVNVYDGWDTEGTCTYCGSLDASSFLDLLASGYILVPTDKNYKAYVEAPDKSGYIGKFYYQHFTHEQRILFIEMYNEQRIKFGTPGYLYVRPYFCVIMP